MTSSSSSSSSSFSWDDDQWKFTVTRKPIYTTDNFSLSPQSHIGWKQELSLTRFSNQDLPEALFGANHLELYHEPSKIKISFSALHALRSWVVLDQPPIPHLSNVPADAWDHTYTTDYPGSTTRTSSPTNSPPQPDKTTLYKIPSQILASSSTPTLRAPLCKCNTGGRRILASVAKSLGSTSNPPIPPYRPTAPMPPPPAYEATSEAFDLTGLLARNSPPLFFERLSLYTQNLDPHSFTSLTATICAASEFVIFFLRCFVRVNGVQVRVIDTKFTLVKGRPYVLRERSWREGTWEQFAGVGAGVHVDLGDEVNQGRIASKKLPLVKPPVVEKLQLDSTTSSARALSPSASVSVAATTKIKAHGLCASSTRAFICSNENNTIVALDLDSGERLWEVELLSPIVAAKSSQEACLLFVGCDNGELQILRADTGSSVHTCCFPKATSQGGRVRNTNLSVEKIAFGCLGSVAAAAGKHVFILSGLPKKENLVEEIFQVEGTVYDIAFSAADTTPTLAVGHYGGVTFLSPRSDSNHTHSKPQLRIGAAAVMCLGASKNELAVGQMDKKLRLGDVEYVGFDGAVTQASWGGEDNRYLAAIGGSVLAVVQPDGSDDERNICICVCGQTRAKFVSFQWQYSKKCSSLLVALDEFGKAYLFDVLKFDDNVPRRCFPVRELFAGQNGLKNLMWAGTGRVVASDSNGQVVMSSI
ncbi:hypothetical protein TrVE_jg1822 [Triparma verrucosa]|uniref:Uncharacterized protein n=1 Tax=Triparma verrucosa TaxID=1606542 RepID=A0A9W7F225_9STRA|nr:hypothetical protein TrVE_jg1822 [Triparma verrucosa]